MSKEFKKDQVVIHFSSWDRKGTWCFTRAIVGSCGAKQMTLRNAVTGEMMGCHFRPDSKNEYTYVFQGKEGVNYWNDVTKPDMSDEDASALCLEFAAAELIRERAKFEHSIATSDSVGYTKATEKAFSELHEPRSLKR